METFAHFFPLKVFVWFITPSGENLSQEKTLDGGRHILLLSFGKCTKLEIEGSGLVLAGYSKQE
jgi:hypothetical protein